MIFSELYSAYYNAVARVIGKILDGEKNPKELQSIVSNSAFEESGVAIFSAIKNEKWHLITKDMSTPIEHKPTMPLTTLEKRWLKAISLDPRVKLFDIDFPDLDGVDPLFTPDDYRVYDKYSDGDPFEDEEYIKKFRTILTAMREGKQIKFEMENRNRAYSYVRCIPERLEYSEKDDKFRIITGGSRAVSTVNIAKMRFCSIYHGNEPLTKRLNRPTQYESVTLKITDRRNALERVMMHFAHFEKQAERMEKDTYLLKIKYDVKDESEILIRVLSFGPMVEVIEPEPFIALVREKLLRQMKLGIK
jgi:hypothetical protein